MAKEVKSNPAIIPCPPGRFFLPYQLDAIRYALGARGTLIADQMGLGKTAEAIGVINASPITDSVLIVCPAGLRLNWINELSAWLVGQRDITVVSYHGAEKLGEALPFGILIVDEAHYIKNPESKRSKVITGLAAKAKRVLMLTGTPIENRPIELWPILKCVAPEKWDPAINRIGAITQEQRKTHPGEGPGFWAFASKYCDLKYTSTQTKRGRWIKAWDYSGASNLDELRRELRRTCMVRRLKEDVLKQLPPKRHQLILLDSPSGIDDSGYLEGMTFENYETTIDRLISDKVAFADFSNRRHEQALKKIDSCLPFIHDALDATRKIIVFAHHRDVIDKLSTDVMAELQGEDYCVTVTGETHVADRMRAVRDFQEDPFCRVFIGSIGAAGVGLTLTAAAHVIFVELDPVPGKMAQAIDRAHRIGQLQSVLVWYLMFDKSLCARMSKIVIRKLGVINQALDGR